MEIIAREPYITGYTQSCAEPGCDKIWYCTKSAMHQILDAQWGNQMCNPHRSKRGWITRRMRVENA